MTGEPPKSAAAGPSWRAYLGQDAVPPLVLIAGTVIAARLLAVSKGRPEVAVALLGADPVALLLALALEFVALLMPAVATACLWYVGRSFNERGLARMANRPPPERFPLGPMLACLVGVLTAYRSPGISPPFAFAVTGAATLSYLAYDRSERKRPWREPIPGADRAFVPDSPARRHEDRAALRRYWVVGLVVTAVSMVMFNGRMWLPAEELTFRDGTSQIGYVLESDPPWTVVMLEKGRRVFPFRTSSIRDRQLCRLRSDYWLDAAYQGAVRPFVPGADIPLPACPP